MNPFKGKPYLGGAVGLLMGCAFAVLITGATLNVFNSIDRLSDLNPVSLLIFLLMFCGAVGFVGGADLS